jgi:hypothetical protein
VQLDSLPGRNLLPEIHLSLRPEDFNSMDDFDFAQAMGLAQLLPISSPYRSKTSPAAGPA